jgi:hypothetical protein
MNIQLLLLCAMLAITNILAEVTIQSGIDTIYDRTPKIRIKWTGFDAEEDDIKVEISSAGQAPLKADKDYTLSKAEDGEGITLKLMQNRKWVKLDGRDPPVAITLSKVTFGDSDKNLLAAGQPKIIANVLRTPSADENDRVIYQEATHELKINCTGFAGAKDIDLFFKPPLFKGVQYEIVSKKPYTKSFITLRKRHGYKWRCNKIGEEEKCENGPIKLIGVDTGGGPIKINGDEGIVVANVESDKAFHGVKVDESSETQKIYHDQSSLTIFGSGFNTKGNTLKFKNGIIGKGVNYTVESSSEDQIRLSLKHGSLWRKNVENLPGYLTLLAVNAGDDFVAIGAQNSQKGRDVAMVFERPQVFSGDVKLYRTHTHELHIKGVGFTKVLSSPQIEFNPPLVEGEDYTISVKDRTDMEVTLLDGRAWRGQAGPLKITRINTRGDEGGWIDLMEDGVHVAQVVEDIDAENTGGVEVYPMGSKVYQSTLSESITITGSGFKSGIKFNFEPALKDGTDYNLDIVNEHKAVMKPVGGKKWRADPGFIICKSIEVDGKTFNLAGADGIRVAVVLEDPAIKAGADSFHETQSKVISIKGTGFTNVADTNVIIRPTAPGAYRVLNVLEGQIRVQLKQGFDWLPGFLSLLPSDGDKKVPLQVTGIDTGAGEIVFTDPITIGFIVKDREGVVCDDSCEFAFDDVCDDGTQSEMSEYYQYYGYYQDDDEGGYYQNKEGNKEGSGSGSGSESEQQKGSYYDDYEMEDDSYKVSACVEGTDCTDCGGVDAVPDYSKKPAADSGVESCDNSCPYARDGVCDDPRGANYCKLGTDCQDCGVVGSDNFTRSDDDEWWDDDDDYWTFNDANFLDQTKGLEANRHRVKTTTKTEGAGPAAMFLVVLEGMVYTIGAIFAAIALYLGMRWYRGASLPFMNAFNPEVQTNSEVALNRMQAKKMPITPDAFRT